MKFRVYIDPSHFEPCNRTGQRKLVGPIKEWLVQHMGKPGYYSSRWGWKGRWLASGEFDSIRFKNSSDAVMFKVTWL